MISLKAQDYKLLVIKKEEKEALEKQRLHISETIKTLMKEEKVFYD